MRDYETLVLMANASAALAGWWMPLGSWRCVLPGRPGEKFPNKWALGWVPPAVPSRTPPKTSQNRPSQVPDSNGGGNRLPGVRGIICIWRVVGGWAGRSLRTECGNRMDGGH